MSEDKRETITYNRPSGNTIDLVDTPKMKQYAKDRGWEPKQVVTEDPPAE